MVSSPIGGFMPIPLAMMPAFMAYQSILMGDAFGSGYQYSKRKISAMSNEDFNKLSLSKLFNEQSAEYERMIPSLKTSMRNSQELQGFIVKELLAIIPNLIRDAFGVANEAATDSPFFKNTQATQQQPTNVRYTTDREPVFNEPAIRNFQKAIDPLLQQRGTREQTASEREAVRAYNRNQLNTRVPYEEPTRPIDNTPTVDSAAQAFRDEINKQTKLVIIHKDLEKTFRNRTDARGIGFANTHEKVWRAAKTKLLSMSRRYRDPNNGIRTSALALRRTLQNEPFI